MFKKKIIKKFLFLLPFGIGLGMLVYLYLIGITPFYWQIGILIGFVITAYFILINVSDYSSINGISKKDYLESNHSYRFEYNLAIWNNFNTLIEHQLAECKSYKIKPNEIIVNLENSIIKMIHENDELILSVKRNSFPFSPDRGKNYHMMEKIVKAIGNNGE